MSDQADRYAKIRLLNARDIEAIFVKVAYQNNMVDGLSIRWDGSDWPQSARDTHQVEFSAGSRTVCRQLSDSALVNLQTNVCLAMVWKMIREAVAELLP